MNERDIEAVIADNAGQTEPGQNGEAPARAASVVLNAGTSGQAEYQALLDPATKSLADALRITYRLLQGAILLLIVVFFASGFQTVGEEERALRTTFGRVVNPNVGPGPQPSWPAPIGELVRIQISPPSIEINEAFWPNIPPNQRGLPIAQLAGFGGMDLNPEQDGSLLTADQAIVHTRWRVSYRRSDPRRYAEHLSNDAEKNLVLSIVRRAIIHAASELTIDEILKNTTSQTRTDGLGTIEDRALARAQAALDQLDIGLRIDTLIMDARIPPLQAMPEFDLVQGAEAEANNVLEQARSYRRTRLTETAGGSAGLLLSLIDRYDAELSSGDRQASASTLANIDAAFRNQPIEVDGRTVNPQVFGRASTLLSDARRDRESLVRRAQARADIFAAKLEAFRVNPGVVLTDEWTRAMQSVLGDDELVSYVLSPGSRPILFLDPDQRIRRERERSRNLQEAERAQRDAERRRLEGRFEEDVQTRSAPVTE